MGGWWGDMVDGKFEVPIFSLCLGLWENVWFVSADVGVMGGGLGGVGMSSL